MTDLVFYVSTLLLAAANLCLSKPTIANDTAFDADSSKSSLCERNAVNTSSISSEDYEYRRRYGAEMLSYMNRSVNPCDDFYEYSCGNWKNVIDYERTSITRRSNIMDIFYKLNDAVLTILQRPNINDVAPEYAEEFELAKKFYNNCIEAELYPMRASAEYLAELEQIGGFPAVENNWNSNNFNWLNMSAHLSNYGVKSLINEVIVQKYPQVPYFNLPEFGFGFTLTSKAIGKKSSNAYLENEKRMRDILTIYGVEEGRVNATIAGIFDFVGAILKVMRSFNEDKAQCKVLQNAMGNSKITALVDKWWMYNEIAWSGKRFMNYTKEYGKCCSPCYYLYEKIDKISEQNKEAAANYLSLKFLFHMRNRLEDTKYQKDYCISKLRSSMKYFFDHLYMKLYFGNELREEVSGIVNGLRESLRFILQNSNWLDEATRKAALLKESKIKVHVGRYENGTMTKLLIGELKKLKYVDGSYEANNINLRKFEQYMNRFKGFNYQKLDNSRPFRSLIGMQANSYFYNIHNSIYVMAGILTEPVYNKAWPNSLKFGALGSVIGHELTHGFDTAGANYDEAGNKKNWWSNESYKIYKERSNCFVERYQSYVIAEINQRVNGFRTQNENIADNEGLRDALLAYRRYIRNLTMELDPVSALYKNEQMPDIDLTPEQLFFLGFGQLWCSSQKEADYWADLNEKHVTNKYRVLGPLRNNVDFAKAYNCPVGSEMNPSLEKCELW